MDVFAKGRVQRYRPELQDQSHQSNSSDSFTKSVNYFNQKDVFFIFVFLKNY